MNAVHIWLAAVVLAPGVPLPNEIRDTEQKLPAILRQDVRARLGKIAVAEGAQSCSDPRRCGPPVARVGVGPSPQSLVGGWAAALAAGEPGIRFQYGFPWADGTLPACEVLRDQFNAALHRDQLTAAARISELEAALKELDALRFHTEIQEDRTIQAKYDYVCAHLAARLALLHEHALLIGQLRKQPPALDAEQSDGWRLVWVERTADSDARQFARRARAALERLAKREAGSAWERIAGAELLHVDGSLEWQLMRRK